MNYDLHNRQPSIVFVKLFHTRKKGLFATIFFSHEEKKFSHEGSLFSSREKFFKAFEPFFTCKESLSNNRHRAKLSKELIREKVADYSEKEQLFNA